MVCGFSRFMKEGEGGPGNGPLAPVDVWQGEDVHVDVAGRGRKKLPQGIAVPPSVHKAEDCPPGEHRHDRFDYCHPEKRKHRGAKKPEEQRPFPPSRTIKQKSQEAWRAWYDSRRVGADHKEEHEALYERYSQLRDLYRLARKWEESAEGQEWISREKVKRAKGQGLKSREHYEAKVAALEEKKVQLDEEHKRLWDKYRVLRGSDREPFYNELVQNTKQLKTVRAGIARAKAQSTIGFAREWAGVIKDIAGGVEPQISAIRTGSRAFAHYGLDDGIIGISDRALELLAKVRDNPDILFTDEAAATVFSSRDKLAVAVSALVHEFMHSVNPAKGAYVKGGITGMIEEGLTESIANRMVARPDVLSALLGTDVDKGIDAKPSAEYKVYVDTMEYMAERAAQRSNTDPEWFLGKWKFHTEPRTRGEAILDDAGMSAEEGYSTAPWRGIIKEAQEKLPKMQEARQAQRANKAFQSAVSAAMDGLWRVAGFEFKGDKYPPETPAPTGGGGSGPAAGPGALVPAGMDVRYTGSPPKGVHREKYSQSSAPGGTGAGAVEAMEKHDTPKSTHCEHDPRAECEGFASGEEAGGRTKEEEHARVMDWLERHEVPQNKEGRYQFYHATPKTALRGIRREGLKAGSLLETDPESAAHFAARDRDLKPHQVAVLPVAVLPHEIRVGMWAALRVPYKVETTS